MTKNEIVAEFLQLKVSKGTMYDSRVYYHIPYYHDSLIACVDQFMFDKSYDWVMPAWVKFRDLKFDINEIKTRQAHAHLCQSIEYKTMNTSITEAFDELVKGIIWYQSLKS